MKPIRRHLNYANVVATLALVFAMGGSAIAADHYLINSTKQINPKVLKKLKGNRGPRGFGVMGQPGPRGIAVTGPQGSQGTKGEQGIKGEQGTRGEEGGLPATLPAGKTLTGVYEVGGTSFSTTESTTAHTSFSFQFPLTARPATHVIRVGELDPTACPGSASNPEALSGNLCIYEAEGNPGASLEVIEPTTNGSGSSAIGAGLLMTSEAAKGLFFSDGSWAVTG